ncbi:MAG TPA: adenylate/guanylate cyclase domain-containing protein, partial [Methylomirabilota bacterium]
MTCAGCGAPASSDFAFCPRCGRKLSRACAGCGFVCEGDFAFCPRCGKSLGATPAPVPALVIDKPATPGREADRRQVTVLFADLSGFTTLAERLDPEVVRAFQSALFETLGRAIARYDGFVEKFVGDAVLAVFGAPVAHEDDPERALGAALDILERGRALSEQWAGRLGQPVTLHVGVHTGPVV